MVKSLNVSPVVWKAMVCALRTAGVLADLSIRLVILLWGLSVYGSGNAVAVFGTPVRVSVFTAIALACVIYDLRQLSALRVWRAKHLAADNEGVTPRYDEVRHA